MPPVGRHKRDDPRVRERGAPSSPRWAARSHSGEYGVGSAFQHRKLRTKIRRPTVICRQNARYSARDVTSAANIVQEARVTASRAAPTKTGSGPVSADLHWSSPDRIRQGIRHTFVEADRHRTSRRAQASVGPPIVGRTRRMRRGSSFAAPLSAMVQVALRPRTAHVEFRIGPQL